MSVNDYRPSCPVVFFARATDDGSKPLYTIHCQKLNINVECYLSTAMIKLQGKWTNRTKNFLDCVFALPTAGTVRNITINIGPERAVTTAILSNEDAKSLIKQKEKELKKPQTKTIEDENENDEDDKKYQNVSIEPGTYNVFEQYIPGLFRLPFSDVAPGDTISINCEYIESLGYYKKGYILSIPLSFPPGTMVDNRQWKDVISIECKIFSLSKATKIDCWTHHIKQTEDTASGIITIKTSDYKRHDVRATATGRDFELSYSVKTDQISAQCISAPDIDDPTSGSLCVLVTPPRDLQATVGRAFFFLVDRSGSMVGEPFRETTRALNRALDRLRPGDEFNIAAIDHRQVYYQTHLVPANNEMIQNAKTWITQSYTPERGGTNLDIPVQCALQMLEKSDLLPFMVLFIDGSVVNEREICETIEVFNNLRTRLVTFGIGQYVNNTFMAKLAHLSRGFSDAVYLEEQIYHKAEHLLRIIQTPCLTDLQIFLNEDLELLVFGYLARYERKYNRIVKIPKDVKLSILAFCPAHFKSADQKRFQVYPFPIPDLCVGAPVVIAARYAANKYPETVKIRGFDPHGDLKTIKAKVKVRHDIPVENALIKQKIDVMTAEAWFKNCKVLEQKVVDASINCNMPSAFTTTVMIETTQDRLNEEDRIVDELMRNVEYNKYQRAKMKAKIRNNKQSVAKLATHIAGTGIVAVGLFAFGDVTGTMNNWGCMRDAAHDDTDFDDGTSDHGCDWICGCDCECIIMQKKK